MIFETPRLIVRPWTLDDAEAAFEIYGDPRVMEPLHSKPTKSLEEQREWLAALIARNAERPHGLGGWAIERKSDGRVLGTCLLKPLPDDTRVEVGWHLGRAYWGNGYATESGAGALALGFEKRGLDEIFAIVDPENAPSQRVCARLGMSVLEVTDRYHGMSLLLYRLTRQDWQRNNSLDRE